MTFTPEEFRTIEGEDSWLTSVHIDGYLQCLRIKESGWWDESHDDRYAVHGSTIFVSVNI